MNSWSNEPWSYIREIFLPNINFGRHNPISSVITLEKVEEVSANFFGCWPENFFDIPKLADVIEQNKDIQSTSESTGLDIDTLDSFMLSTQQRDPGMLVVHDHERYSLGRKMIHSMNLIDSSVDPSLGDGRGSTHQKRTDPFRQGGKRSRKNGIPKQSELRKTHQW